MLSLTSPIVYSGYLLAIAYTSYFPFDPGFHQMICLHRNWSKNLCEPSFVGIIDFLNENTKKLIHFFCDVLYKLPIISVCLYKFLSHL